MPGGTRVVPGMRAIRFSGLLVLATAACPPVNSPGGGVESVQSDLNAPNRIVLAAPADVAGGTSIALSDLENWVHWGLTGTGANRKANVTPQLARVFTKVGSGTIAPDPGSSGFPHYVWNNGSPTVSADTKAGIKTGSTSTGFQFSVPVTTTPKRTRIYLTIFSAKATLEVKMAGATTVTSIIDQMGATRRTVSVDADIWSATTQEATVNLTLGKNYGGGLVILNAAATLPLDRAFSNAAHTLTVTPAAGAPQPVRYGANESPTGQLLPLVGSHVSLQARFTGATRDLLYGGELWRDNALWRETSTVSGNLVGFDFDETVAAPTSTRSSASASSALAPPARRSRFSLVPTRRAKRRWPSPTCSACPGPCSSVARAGRCPRPSTSSSRWTTPTRAI